MVSTRGLKYKFGEGEKVLCYEPDPTKAKVLYDSKVLEVVENKDKRGRKSIEYLIHFQGWNSSWDRCVREDYVLKDTEENRQLQRDLAAKSQLQIGAYLYRRCRNKRSRKLSDRIHDATGGKVRRTGSSEDGSSCSGQRDIDTDDTQHEDGDSETCSSIDNIDMTDDERVHIDIGETLRTLLEHDFENVKLQNKLHNLPISPNVVTILENYVKHYALEQLTMVPIEPSRGRKSSATKKIRDFDKICRNLNICKEVCDGLRIYFDFTLRDHLLYLPEAEQLTEYLDKVVKQKDDIDNTRNNLEAVVKQEEEDDKLAELPPSPQSPSDIPLFAHLSVEPSMTIPELDLVATTTTTIAPTPKANPNLILNEPRRLRSHKLELVQEAAQEVVQLNSTTRFDVVVKEEPDVSIATTSSCCSTPRYIPSNDLNVQTSIHLPPKWKDVLKQVEAWKIIPDEDKNDDTTKAPSLIYGAVHLARLLVKLPEFLSAANIAVDKLPIILKHIDNFIDYLETHKEWFEEVGSK